MKICTKCEIEKELLEFYFRKDCNNYRNQCKECFSHQTKVLKYETYPWRKHFYAARRRCNIKEDKQFQHYGGKGIKFKLSILVVMPLWAPVRMRTSLCKKHMLHLP